MTEQTLYPMLFTPVLKDYIWGGRNLADLGRDLPEGITAESWEIAGHKDGTTAVANGTFAGQLLTEVQAQLELDLIGSNNRWAHERGKFPLLIKLLDANRPLSVQVHPDDTYALEHEGNELGKTEMWVVLRAEPDAAVILGVQPGTTPEAFRADLEAGQLERHLYRIPVQAGDVVCVPAGSLHAILEGLVIAEIQQNSNTTYRVYDWNRVGTDGKPRPLHVDKAMDVINFEQVAPSLCAPLVVEDSAEIKREQLCSNQYFITERVTIQPGATFEGNCDGRTLEIWGAVVGNARINDVALTAVQFALLPAAMGKFAVSAEGDAPTTLLRSYVPDPA